jgi:methylenetetrahydrofolate dehydrogenase (NADP+)/methenyltetrahydrofolate cyclohydrolase
MPAKIIDGKALAHAVRQECKLRVNAFLETGRRPGLAVVLVGADPASKLYVRNKIRACEEVGIFSSLYEFPANAPEAAVLDTIALLNEDPSIDGVLVQLPLPAHIAVSEVLESISPQKDVDGFHLYNVGRLITGSTIFPPCTPYGVMRLLEAEGIPVSGLNVTVVGASNIVGKPMALMLMQEGATVSVCHALTRDLAEYTTLADLLIVAAGKPGLILPEMVKEGAVVIDVGINRLPDGSITGDVDFEGVRQKASHITPVPGGVGPMTVTMLMVNTIVSAERSLVDA